MDDRSLCVVSSGDFARHFADVEPLSLCQNCGQEIPTAYERCASCQAKHDEFLDNTAADPRR